MKYLFKTNGNKEDICRKFTILSGIVFQKETGLSLLLLLLLEFFKDLKR